jgi:hypothetical protein
MLWGQSITVYMDHENLTRDALGLTSDRVYQWRLLLEKYAPKLIYIKGICNTATDTVSDTVSRLEYNPALNPTNEYTRATQRVSTEKESAQKWNSFSHHWQSYNESNAYTHILCIQMSKLFGN